jgi:hypothetical protein
MKWETWFAKRGESRYRTKRIMRGGRITTIGVVVKFFPITKPKWIYNNVLMHNNRDVDKITRNICLKWKLKTLAKGYIQY